MANMNPPRTFADARAIVQANPRDDARGTWWAAPWGWEDRDGWCVVAGVREWLEEWDTAYMPPVGAPGCCMVNRDGSVEWVTYHPGTADGERIDAMAEVGQHPDDEGRLPPATPTGGTGREPWPQEPGLTY